MSPWMTFGGGGGLMIIGIIVVGHLMGCEQAPIRQVTDLAQQV